MSSYSELYQSILELLEFPCTLVMLLIFIAGFFIDFIEIIFIIVPVVAPIFAQMGVDLVWLGILIALNLQTSFLTPPFGFSLFYLKGVAPPEVTTAHLYRGIIPFIVIQVIMLLLIILFPGLLSIINFQGQKNSLYRLINDLKSIKLIYLNYNIFYSFKIFSLFFYRKNQPFNRFNLSKENNHRIGERTQKFRLSPWGNACLSVPYKSILCFVNC